MALKYQRLRAPARDGQALQVPLLAEFPGRFTSNRERIERYSFELAGTAINQFRASAREDLLAAAKHYSRRYRDVAVPDQITGIVMGGHQPTLFHPGVWYKNFALDAAAGSTGSVAINLIVDNDFGQIPAINVPTGTPRNPQPGIVRFDSRSSQRPYELEPLHDRAMFESFAERVVASLGGFVAEPLVTKLWPRVMDALEVFPFPALAIAAGRHSLEGSCGLNTLEIPLSDVCQTRSFAQFVSEMLTRRDAFCQIHNEILTKFRKVNRIRSTSHPVPALEMIDGWVEVPFWVWTDASLKRSRLFAKGTDEQIVVSDLASFERSLSKNDLVDQVYELVQSGIHVRTRALTTTMYSRLILADAFFHGIGGAKYDQMTDAIMARFFGIDPPEYNIATATFRLPVDFTAWDSSDKQRLQTRQRNLRFHAERFGDLSNPAFAQIVHRKQQHLQSIPANGGKKAWHDEMEAINQSLQPGVRDELGQIERELAEMDERIRVSSLLGSREYSFCLFDESLIDGLHNPSL